MDKKQEVFEHFEVPDPIRIKKAYNFITEYFKDLRNLNLLECGVAKGGLADMLKKEGVRCFGVDVNPREINGIKIIQSDLNKGIPDFGVKFDIIFAGEVMEHLFDDSAFLQHCREALRPDGILIITVPNLVFGPNRFLMLFGQVPKYFAYAPYHYHMYNRKTLASMFKEGNLKVLKLVSTHILFSTRRNKLGRVFEILGDIFPSLGAHLIVFAKKL
ncbi:MAG: class I SAM-dependent methyltransferase [Patescibacteria group bacterium]